MSDTAKLKAPKGTSAISVLGKEYKVVKGFVVVAVEHVAELVGFGFTGADGEDLEMQEVDPSLPAGVKSNLVHVNPPGPTAEELAAAERVASEASAQAAKDEEEKRLADEAEAERVRAEAEEQAAKDAAAAGPAAPVLE